MQRISQSTTAQQHTKGIWNMDMGPQHENATFGCLYRAAKLPQTIKLIEAIQFGFQISYILSQEVLGFFIDLIFSIEQITNIIGKAIVLTLI